MHELSYMIKFIDMADEALKGSSTPDANVRQITVEVGEMTGVLPEYLEKYFPQVIKDTPFSNAKLKVISIPTEALCTDCNKKYHPDKSNDYKCPDCKSVNARIIHGRELNLNDIAVDVT